MTMHAARGQWIAVGIILTLLAGALTVGLLLTEDIAQVTVGARAPNFNAANLATGDSVSLDDYRGEVVLLNVWATNCAPCRWEMPSMERLHAKLGPAGLKVVAVSVDRLSGERVAAFAGELGLTFDVLHDPRGQIELDYQTTGLPETVIIDREGVIVHKAIGAVDWDDPVHTARFRRFLGVADADETETPEEPAPTRAQAGVSGG